MASSSRKIRGLTIEFGADASKLLQGLSEVENKLRKTKTLYDDINKLMKIDPKNTEILAQKQGELNNRIQETKDKIEQLKKIQEAMKMDGIEENSREMQALRREIIDNENSLKSYQKELQKTTEKLNIHTTATGKFGLKLNEVGNKLVSFGDKTIKFGEKISKVGNKLSLFITTPMTILGKKIINASTSFESGLAGVAKTSNMTELQLKSFGQEIEKMTRVMPQSAEEMLAVAEAAGQLGIADEDILKFTEVMLKMGQATNLSSEEAATALARFANIMGTTSDKYSNMGSAIVELGNNFATTESEILELGLRLSATSHQVKLSESQVFGLAAAMSSMGITAEAGGSAMSRVMQKINTSVISSDKKLKKFADTAGLSAEDFAKRWKEKPQEALIMFLEGVDKVNKSGGDTVTLLKDMGISAIREVDAMGRLASNTTLVKKAMESSNKAYKANTALSKEAGIRNKTLASRMAMVKNQIMEIGRQVGEILIPYVEEGLKTLQDWIEKFRNLDDGTKKLIVHGGLLLTALGPIFKVVGVGTKGFGILTKLLGKTAIGAGKVAMKMGAKGGLVTALAKSGTGAVALKTTLLGAGKAILGFLGGPWGIALTAAITTGVVAFNHFRKKTIEEVDLFSSGVSEKTKKALGSFLKLSDDSEKALKGLMWSGATITAEGITPIISNFSKMREQVTTELSTQKDEALKLLKESLDADGLMYNEKKKKLLDSVRSTYDERIKKTTEAEEQIKKILETASNEKRSLTLAEKEAINTYQQQMKDEGVKTLTATEEEYKIIRQRMKDNAGEISALEAAEIVQTSLQKKEEGIRIANEEYDEKIRIAEKLRAEGGKEAEEAADKIIEEAKRQRDKTVQNVTEMHDEVVKKAKSQAGEHVKHVNWETGQVKNNWDIFKEDVGRTWDSIKDWAGRTWEATGKAIQSFTDNATKWVSKKWSEAKSFLSNTWDTIKGTAGRAWGGVKSTISTAMDSAKRFASEKATNIKNNLTTAWEGIKSVTGKAWGGVKDTITGTVSKAWGGITGTIEKLKNAFNFKWSLPKFKLPRISVWTEPGILGIPIPKFDLTWNRMGGIFKQPTVLPTLAGFQGFAEPSTGGEAIMPLDKLPQLMAEAMELSNQSRQQTIINYIILDGKVIGKEVTNTVDENLGRKTIRERYSGGF